MAKLTIFSILSNVSMLVFTRRKGEFVGEDGDGNKYYRAPARKGYKRERRWVMYEGAPEASNVPPEWHGWLHYQTDAVPGDDTTAAYRKDWQKEHKPNLTGTAEAYMPPGHTLKGGARDAATGDYEAWTPGD